MEIRTPRRLLDSNRGDFQGAAGVDLRGVDQPEAVEGFLASNGEAYLVLAENFIAGKLALRWLRRTSLRQPVFGLTACEIQSITLLNQGYLRMLQHFNIFLK